MGCWSDGQSFGASMPRLTMPRLRTCKDDETRVNLVFGKVTVTQLSRTTNVKLQILLILLMGLLLAGCGGSGGTSTVGDVTGFIQDINGNPVRNATIFVDGGPQTVSNSAGSYRLAGVNGDTVTIKATVTQDGTAYYGENTVQLFNQETSKSTNITMIPANQRATISGTVQDRFGNLVQGAHVFVASINGSGQPTVWSSSYVLTDSNGNFSITTLLGGQSYSIIASAVGFNSDTDTISVPQGQTFTELFTLKNPTDPLLTPPANIEGIAWTTPFEATTRATSQQAGLEAIKQMIDPRRKQHRVTRDTTTGNFVEIDLDWSPMSDPSLIGFNIYRASGNVAASSLVNVDFYRDPQATLYEDLDPNFQENQTYTYAATSLNTNAGVGTTNSESAFSSLVVVSTLADMVTRPVTFGPLAFNWNLVSGADTYTVYVFDRYPSIGITSLWNASTSGNQLAYAGPSLTSGHTYY